MCSQILSVLLGAAYTPNFPPFLWAHHALWNSLCPDGHIIHFQILSGPVCTSYTRILTIPLGIPHSQMLSVLLVKPYILKCSLSHWTHYTLPNSPWSIRCIIHSHVLSVPFDTSYTLEFSVSGAHHTLTYSLCSIGCIIHTQILCSMGISHSLILFVPLGAPYTLNFSLPHWAHHALQICLCPIGHIRDFQIVFVPMGAPCILSFSLFHWVHGTLPNFLCPIGNIVHSQALSVILGTAHTPKFSLIHCAQCILPSSLSSIEHRIYSQFLFVPFCAP